MNNMPRKARDMRDEQADYLFVSPVSGSDTQSRMIQAAIEVFGSLGYAGASTRQLAKHAGVNQAAIPYHFGGKRELYLAAASAIADNIQTRVDPIIAALRDDRGTDPVSRIERSIIDFFQLLAGDDPEAWTEFFVRSERDADDAFEIIYHQAVARFQAQLIEAIAQATGVPPTDEDLNIRVVIVLGSIANFRTLRNVMLSSLGWDKLDVERRTRLETAIRQFALAHLLGNRPTDRAIPRHASHSLADGGHPPSA
ncbi:transcriptional regulator, TetR family [Rhodopseudomonas palustris BisB5]|uniref:Transcriptional regulator, TetR family n=3 Tax=Rhodopseudomonas TaxID=1073 RepID=Q135V9_RHOPS|nr:transcriptional regulator, TetR family [Rhodopseudomonas palustris BisB5]